MKWNAIFYLASRDHSPPPPTPPAIPMPLLLNHGAPTVENILCPFTTSSLQCFLCSGFSLLHNLHIHSLSVKKHLLKYDEVRLRRPKSE